MKAKILFAFVLTAFLALALVSAADFTLSVSNSLSKSVNESTLTITNTNVTDDINVTLLDINDIDDNDGHSIIMTQSKSGILTIPAGTSVTATIGYTLSGDDDLKDLALGDYSTTISATQDTGVEIETVSTSVSFYSTYCEDGTLRELTGDRRELELVSIKDKTSDKDWEWKPLDNVEIDVKVRFNSDDNDDDVDAIIYVALYDTEDKEFIELDGDDQLERDISLDEGDSITETFILKVPAEDIVDSSNRYRLYVKLFEDGNEDVICSDQIGGDEDYQEVDINKETYMVILDEIDFTSPVPCGEEVIINAIVYNVGKKDEDRVQVSLYSSELGLDMKSNTMSLDEGESERVSFTFKIPDKITEKTYRINLYTSYRYSDSSKNYRDQSDNFDVLLNVAGNCVDESALKNAQITAELDPETPTAMAGKQVAIRANIKNTGLSETTYVVTVLGNSLWSELDAIEPSSMTLQPGASKDVSIILTIDDTASGEKDFTIRTTYDGKMTEQVISLAVEKAEDTSTPVEFNALADHIKKNWFIYVIILVNIILIIAIVSVVRRMVAPRPM